VEQTLEAIAKKREIPSALGAIDRLQRWMWA